MTQQERKALKKAKSSYKLNRNTSLGKELRSEFIQSAIHTIPNWGGVSFKLFKK